MLLTIVSPKSFLLQKKIASDSRNSANEYSERIEQFNKEFDVVEIEAFTSDESDIENEKNLHIRWRSHTRGRNAKA